MRDMSALHPFMSPTTTGYVWTKRNEVGTNMIVYLFYFDRKTFLTFTARLFLRV